MPLHRRQTVSNPYEALINSLMQYSLTFVQPMALVNLLGIDPGYRRTGLCILEVDKQEGRYIHSEAVNMPDLPLVERMGKLYSAVDRLCRAYLPKAVAVERVFLGKNVVSALKLGHARGAAICATYQLSIPVYEYSARFIKKTITGHGNASKQQVAFMISRLLRIAGKISEDENDALAVAMCCNFTERLWEVRPS